VFIVRSQLFLREIYYGNFMGKAINIEYGIIDFENDIIDTTLISKVVTSNLTSKMVKKGVKQGPPWGGGWGAPC